MIHLEVTKLDWLIQSLREALSVELESRLQFPGTDLGKRKKKIINATYFTSIACKITEKKKNVNCFKIAICFP